MNGYWGGQQWGGYVNCRWGGLDSITPTGEIFYNNFYIGYILGV